jgi:prevent-host-death family protein
MQMNIHDAKTNLSKLIEAARNGEEVIIARNGEPMVRLVAVAKGKFRFGTLKHLLKGPIPDFLEPMPEDELRLWEGGDDEIRP